MNRKKTVFFLTLTSLIFQAFSLPFNENLTSEDVENLFLGKAVDRTLRNEKSLSLETKNEGAEKLRAVFSSLKPNYLGEIVRLKKEEGNEDLPAKVKSALLDFPSYVGIPYYSKQHDTVYDLYSSAKVKRHTKLPDGREEFLVDLVMQPFGNIQTLITVEEGKDYFIYISENQNKLRYNDKISCIGERQLKCVLVVFKENGQYVLYAAGGAKAIRLPFIEKRVEVSLINRIKTFASFIYDKL